MTAAMPGIARPVARSTRARRTPDCAHWRGRIADPGARSAARTGLARGIFWRVPLCPNDGQARLPVISALKISRRLKVVGGGDGRRMNGKRGGARIGGDRGERLAVSIALGGCGSDVAFSVLTRRLRSVPSRMSSSRVRLFSISPAFRRQRGTADGSQRTQRPARAMRRTGADIPGRISGGADGTARAGPSYTGERARGNSCGR